MNQELVTKDAQLQVHLCTTLKLLQSRAAGAEVIPFKRLLWFLMTSKVVQPGKCTAVIQYTEIKRKGFPLCTEHWCGDLLGHRLRAAAGWLGCCVRTPADPCCDPPQAAGRKPPPVIVLAWFHSLLQMLPTFLSTAVTFSLALKPDAGQIRQRLARCVRFPRLSTSALARSALLPAKAE